MTTLPTPYCPVPAPFSTITLKPEEADADAGLLELLAFEDAVARFEGEADAEADADAEAAGDVVAGGLVLFDASLAAAVAVA